MPRLSLAEEEAAEKTGALDVSEATATEVERTARTVP